MFLFSIFHFVRHSGNVLAHELTTNAIFSCKEGAALVGKLDLDLIFSGILS